MDAAHKTIPRKSSKNLSRPQSIRIGRVTGNKTFSFFALLLGQLSPLKNILSKLTIDIRKYLLLKALKVCFALLAKSVFQSPTRRKLLKL